MGVRYGSKGTYEYGITDMIEHTIPIYVSYGTIPIYVSYNPSYQGI